MAARRIRYLCIDDEREAQVEPLLDRFRQHGLDVALAYPAAFDEEVDDVARGKADGLLLDLRLDGVPSATGERVGYRALSLAQELRTRMTEGTVRPMPIVLWSVEKNFARSYSADPTGHDLFDLVLSKSDIGEDSEVAAKQLASLASDYPALNRWHEAGTISFRRASGLGKKQLLLLDPRIESDIPANAPVHEWARLFLQDLLSSGGPLVDERLLAARLGVEPLGPSWEVLRERFAPCVYTGVFSAGWPRWWWPLIESEWRRLANGALLRSLSAEERVAILKRATGIRRLRVAVNPHSAASRFWYVCAALNTPLDPQDAVLTQPARRKPWQDPRFVSVEAALSRRATTQGFQIDSLERPRLELLAQARHKHAPR